MATDSAVRSVTNALSGTTADAVTLTQPWDRIAITNHADTPLYVTFDGSVPVGSADNTSVIPAASTRIFHASLNVSNQHTIGIVGTDGDNYTIEGLAGQG